MSVSERSSVMPDLTFDDLEPVKVVDCRWSGNNMIVRVAGDQDDVLEDSFMDEITKSQFSKPQQEDVIDDVSTTEESSNTNVGSSRKKVIDDHPSTATVKEVPQRSIDKASEMDIFEFVDQAKNSNTKSAEQMVSLNIGKLHFKSLFVFQLR